MTFCTNCSLLLFLLLLVCVLVFHWPILIYIIFCNYLSVARRHQRHFLLGCCGPQGLQWAEKSVLLVCVCRWLLYTQYCTHTQWKSWLFKMLNKSRIQRENLSSLYNSSPPNISSLLSPHLLTNLSFLFLIHCPHPSYFQPWSSSFLVLLGRDLCLPSYVTDFSHFLCVIVIKYKPTLNPVHLWTG